MFGASMLLLFASVDNGGWQQGSVAGRWMLLFLTAPALVFAAGLTPTEPEPGRRQVLGAAPGSALPHASERGDRTRPASSMWPGGCDQGRVHVR